MTYSEPLVLRPRDVALNTTLEGLAVRVSPRHSLQGGLWRLQRTRCFFMPPKHIRDANPKQRIQQSKIYALNPPQDQQRPVKACK